MKQVVFETTSTGQDWRWQYRLLQASHAKWEPEEAITLSMSPDFVQWDDYGRRTNSFPPPGPGDVTAPFFQATSGDGSGVVVLTDPNLIDVWVPWGYMRQMGPGTVRVSLAYLRDPLPAITPLGVDPLTLDEARILAKRRGVPVQSIVDGVPLGPSQSRTTLIVGTLPVADGVG
jgi:hypothetical protein